MITRTQKSNTIKLVATAKSPNSADEKDKVYQKGRCKTLNTFLCVVYQNQFPVLVSLKRLREKKKTLSIVTEVCHQVSAQHLHLYFS